MTPEERETRLRIALADLRAAEDAVDGLGVLVGLRDALAGLEPLAEAGDVRAREALVVALDELERWRSGPI